MNLNEFLHKVEINDLDLPSEIIQKLYDQNLTEFQKIYSAVQSYRTFGRYSIKGLSDEEMKILSQRCTDLMKANGLIKSKGSTVHGMPEMTHSLPKATDNHREIPGITKPTVTINKYASENDYRNAEKISQTIHQDKSCGESSFTLSPLANWEARLAPQIKNVELIGEILISEEMLKDISLHFRRLFDNHDMDEVLNCVERNYPATFLVFMVGEGIFGYKDGDFWSSYKKALNCSIDASKFGKLFEKLIQHFKKPHFRDLQERGRRYVDPILAHGGIPVYCLKDFFSNIVVNCAIRPQLFALEGEELAEEVIRHTTYTANTDKPVLNFLEYGGTTAANLLNRARNLLLTWQQNQAVLSAEDAGLPAHITQYFAKWACENAALFSEHGSRTKLKRPQLSIDPWGLGIFLDLPSQPVSAVHINNLYWKVEAGDYTEVINPHTQPKGDQFETRSITLRLNRISNEILIQFSQGSADYEWKISGYSPNHLILAFDPSNGHIQNHILARESWLLFPEEYSLSVQAGEGNLLEVLPELPGEWSKLKLECWDLSQTTSIGLIKDGKVFREIYVRNQEKIEQPILEGGRIVPTDIEQYPIPVYAGMPPSIRIPLRNSEDLRSELGRWQIAIDNIGPADPETSLKLSLVNLPETDYSIEDKAALIYLSAPTLLSARPAGTYQIAIKGPLGRDAAFKFHILPECEVIDLQELYIPDQKCGPVSLSFAIQTSLLSSVDILNKADGITIDTEKSGLYHLLVPPEISSVGLMVRQEMGCHQFIQTPVHFQIKRLRWRMVGDNGRLDNWIQKYAVLSLQNLLQEDSPLLIVDLPGNKNLSLEINLLDIQGNLVQRLKPADHSSRQANRFWRFDLSKIMHSMEKGDSPIYRVDLVGAQESMRIPEINLPVLVFTREIRITQMQSETYPSLDQYHVLLTWKEKNQLRSRTLILWSLFRPWQSPITEPIPDCACGEYEFSITRKDHAEGMYRMQMVVVDPWMPSLPPPLPPAKDTTGYFELEISSTQELLKRLNTELLHAPRHDLDQFSKRIEVSLIQQYLGDMEASNHDLGICCRDIRLATSSREIFALYTILVQTNSENINKEFGEQIIQADVLNGLYKDMNTGEITLSEFTSILTLAPLSKDWPTESCEILVQLEDPKIRFGALIQLIARNISKAVFWIVKLLQQSMLSYEDAVELLYEEKLDAVEQLRKTRGDPFVEQLLDLLSRYNPYSGLPVIKAGSWVLTNAGWGRIEEILDPHTRISVDSFIEGKGKYILSVFLNIYESPDLSGEKALVDMATEEITFPRANRIFICPHCDEFVTASLEIFKYHLVRNHGNALPYPGELKKFTQLTKIQFSPNLKRDENEEK